MSTPGDGRAPDERDLPDPARPYPGPSQYPAPSPYPQALAILASGGTPDGSAILQPHVLLPIGGLVILALIPVVLKRFRHRPASNLEQSS